MKIIQLIVKYIKVRNALNHKNQEIVQVYEQLAIANG